MSQIQKDEKKKFERLFVSSRASFKSILGEKKKKKVNLRFKKSEGKKIHPSIPLASHNS